MAILDFTVPHKCLLQKLAHMGISGRIFTWTTTFLMQSSQQVVVEGLKSSTIHVDPHKALCWAHCSSYAISITCRHMWHPQCSYPRITACSNGLLIMELTKKTYRVIWPGLLKVWPAKLTPWTFRGYPLLVTPWNTHYFPDQSEWNMLPAEAVIAVSLVRGLHAVIVGLP